MDIIMIQQNNTTIKPMDRKCATCKKKLPLNKFFANPIKKDGLFSTCKDCCNERRRKKKPVIHPDGEKECFKCKQMRPYSHFSVNKAKSDGYHYYCKFCTKKAEKPKEINYAEFYYPINLD